MTYNDFDSTPIVLIDLHNMIFRNLFMCISLMKKYIKKVNGKYELKSYKTEFTDMLLKNILAVKKQFKTNNIILCEDYQSWRKDIYTEYKAQRQDIKDKSEINFSEVYEYLNELILDLSKNFPIITMKVNKAEGDDVIAVLTKYFATNILNDIIIVSTDKDFVQLLSYRTVKIYDPLKRKFRTPTRDEILEHIKIHILTGDKADNIPKIVDRTEFSNEFIAFLQKSGIHKSNVNDVRKLTIFNHLLQEYKNKYPNKDVYKKIKFGPKSALKFSENLEKNINSNTIYKENYELNKTLILFNKIPEYVENAILNELFSKDISELVPDVPKMSNWCMKNGLLNFMTDVHLFGTIQTENTAKFVGKTTIPFHPGAIKYFKEIGAIK